MIALYAIASGLQALPAVRGIEGAALRWSEADGLQLVFSEHDAPPPARKSTVLEHARVVEAVAERCDALLPARFGHASADVEALRRSAADAADALHATLARVRGCIEIGLRVVGAPAPAAAASSGRAYMERQLERTSRCDRLAREIDEPLAALARAATHTMSAQPRFTLTAGYLMEPKRVAAFRRRVAQVERMHPGLAFACTGPWPPYSFAEVAA